MLAVLDALPTATTLFFPFGARSSDLKVGIHTCYASEIGGSGIRVYRFVLYGLGSRVYDLGVRV